MEKADQFRINSPKVIHETIDGETVIVNLDSGNYYSLNRVGADIWSMIGTGLKVQDLIEDIAGLYPVEREAIASAVLRFIDELQTEELVVVDNSQMRDVKARPEAGVGTAQTGGKLTFEPPALQKYSDMQDLLLLDPIHEVDDAGWPSAKTADT
ncbi:MAG TPA: PqqD family protein [Thermodesulfovibrionales bacterium]|nr:PqqD family protein [Thermodesulfovibrionales bacterium]